MYCLNFMIHTIVGHPEFNNYLLLRISNYKVHKLLKQKWEWLYSILNISENNLFLKLKITELYKIILISCSELAAWYDVRWSFRMHKPILIKYDVGEQQKLTSRFNFYLDQTVLTITFHRSLRFSCGFITVGYSAQKLWFICSRLHSQEKRSNYWVGLHWNWCVYEHWSLSINCYSLYTEVFTSLHFEQVSSQEFATSMDHPKVDRLSV